jgi:SPP1 family predicted phage head-tail adaptor
MRAGRLRERVTLQQPVTTQDGYGQDVETWADVASLWAGVEPLRGREYHEAQQHTNDVTVRVVIRRPPSIDIRPTWRVVHGATTYQIEAIIDPGSRGIFLELMCRLVL